MFYFFVLRHKNFVCLKGKQTQMATVKVVKELTRKARKRTSFVSQDMPAKLPNYARLC
jgi:hypothetical protein